MCAQKKSKNNFAAQEPRQGWAYFPESDRWRRTPQPWGAPGDHFPRELGDWVAVGKPKSWQPPAGTLAGESLLGSGGAGLELFTAPEGGTGGHTKIGAGHKPQPYDDHGRYTGPGGGGSAGQDGMMYESEPGDEPDAESGAEPEGAPGEEASTGEEAGAIVAGGFELTDILLADNSRVATDAGGGLSGGYEVRGPVTGEVRDPVPPPPAELTWKNDDPNKPDPRKEDLTPKTQQAVEKMKTEMPQLEPFNVNSGKRPGDSEQSTNAHVQGRAVDINEVNGARIKDVVGGNDAAAKERLRQQSAEIEAWGRQNKDVEMVITPYGGFYRYPGGNGEDMRNAKPEEIAAHWNHIHIQTRK